MKLLIEDFPYKVTDELNKILDGLFTLQNVKGEIAVNYVGYFYNPKIKDVVYVLPKVIVDEQNKAFGQFDPNAIIDVDKADIGDERCKFLYEFAVWIHRAIVVFKDANPESTIVHSKELESVGKGIKKKSNTLLDIILALIRFNKENKAFFTFILKNIHAGFNKINWGKTISRTTAMVQSGEAIYLNPVNKKRQINFDEELIVIFFSILQYVCDKYGFKSDIAFGFKLIKGAQFKKYLNGYGRKRLLQIKYKYFSDTALRLWELCFAFFDKTYQINVSATQSEYLLVNSFHTVFESIIDELIGDHDVPKGLKDQDDGKLVDHFYTYDGLLIDRKEQNDMYYIGDSKYYKIGAHLENKSISKQYTYARNVIQWNINLFLSDDAKQSENSRYHNIELRNPETEGYNVIPNFFISADINPDTLDYNDRTKEHVGGQYIRRQFENRLYDRDTLILSRFDVNFLHIISLYAQNNAGAKAAYQSSVRKKFRESIQKILRDNFDFYAISPHADVDAAEYFKSNFQDTLGKAYKPFLDKGIISIALDKASKYKTENDNLIAKLSKSFYVVKCPLGEDPSGKIASQRNDSFGNGYGTGNTAQDLVLVGSWSKKSEEVVRKNKLYYVPVALEKGTLTLVSGFENTKFLLLHNHNSRLLVRLAKGGPKFFPKSVLEALGFTPHQDFYLGFEIVNFNPVENIDPDSYAFEKFGLQRFRPYFTTLDKFKTYSDGSSSGYTLGDNDLDTFNESEAEYSSPNDDIEDFYFDPNDIQ